MGLSDMSQNGIEASVKANRNERDIERLAADIKELSATVERNHKAVLDLISEIKEENATQKGANRAVLYIISTAIALAGLAKTLGWI